MDFPMYRDEKKEYQLEMIQDRIQKNGGIFRTKDAEELNIDYRRLQSFVKAGNLRKIKSGYYTDDKTVSEEALIVSLFPDGIFTMETALYYYGYLDSRPDIWKIAIDKNTSKGRFHLEYPWVTPFYTEPEVMKIGVTTIEVCNKEVQIYDKERLICDVLKYRDKMEAKDFRKAVFSYIEDENKDVEKLLDFAEQRKVRKKVQDLIGVWLD